MQKNKKWIIVAAIVLVIIIGGSVFYLLNKPANKSGSSSKSASTITINNSIVTTKTDSSLGNYFADLNGKALYIYNGDAIGVSNCTGSCLETWPAYIDKGATTGLPASFGTITRQDNGVIQYTYNGMPLYYFTSDTNGQVTGNGVSNFQIAQPSSVKATPPSNTNSTQSSPSYY